jgi:hypothetical protein
LANYSPNIPTGVVHVHGAPATIDATFVASAQYLITFDESSLPAGTTWYVNITGQPALSTTVAANGTSSLSISLGNATYEYTVATDSASWTWNVSSTGTSFQVAGAPHTISLQFKHVAPRVLYAVTFSETGLPSADRFSVQIDGQTLSQPAPSDLVIQLPDGTYTFTVYSDPGAPPYAPNETSGTVIVAAHPVTVALTFSEGNTSTPTGAASPFPGTWVIVGVIVLLMVLIALSFFLAGRRRKKEEPPTQPFAPVPGGAPPSDPGRGSG